MSKRQSDDVQLVMDGIIQSINQSINIWRLGSGVVKMSSSMMCESDGAFTHKNGRRWSKYILCIPKWIELGFACLGPAAVQVAFFPSSQA